MQSANTPPSVNAAAAKTDTLRDKLALITEQSPALRTDSPDNKKNGEKG